MAEESDARSSAERKTDAAEQVSRRRFFQRSVWGTALAGAFTFLISKPASARGWFSPGYTGYVPKPHALYRDYPRGRRRCAGCVHFLHPYACRIVIGPISPNGWCRFWHGARRGSGPGPGRGY